jgi:hypothetical protein
MKYLDKNYLPCDIEGLRTIIVPSGIGELQWACAKYINTGERFAFLGLDGAPRRLHQFVELLPFCEAFAYVGYDYSQIRMWQEYHALTTWAAVTRKFELGQPTMLACNPHLEAGKPLRDWLPDLETRYRFPLRTRPEHWERARRYLDNADDSDVLIGISCASYRGAEAWNTWNVEQWIAFLRRIALENSRVRFVMLGGSWDDLSAKVFDDSDMLRWLTDDRGFPPIGRTDFGTAVEILTGIDGYIGFSSGLGHVAAHCCNCPVFMLWPEHEQLLSKSWVDPELLDNGRYVPSRWLEPDVVFRAAQPWLRRVYGSHP